LTYQTMFDLLTLSILPTYPQSQKVLILIDYFIKDAMRVFPIECIFHQRKFA